MILIIDANSVIAALIRDSKAREIIVSGSFTLVSPDYLREEITKHKDYIVKKSKISREELDILITLILRKINIIPYSEYRNRIVEAKDIMKVDLKDIPYVACYLALNCDGIWTNDKDYKNPKLKLFSTEYLLKLL